MITIHRQVRLKHRGRTNKACGKPAVGRVPRVARLMALAIRFDQLIRDGVVADQAELARLGHVTRARLTQIMNMLQLAPDIQEQVLFLSRIERGGKPIQEHELRQIAAILVWRRQRLVWKSNFYQLRAGQCDGALDADSS